MTTPLSQKHCIPCEDPNMPPMDAASITTHIQQLKKGWTVVENKKIEKKFNFINFKAALAFLNEVGDIAEFEGHHPDMNLHNFNKVTITLSTHAIKGLSENDFILASKIDEIDVEV